MGFTKLDEGILLSSIMREPPETFKVWIALLAACKEDGVAHVSIPGIAAVCFLPIETVENSITLLESPDEYSRSLNNDGRRIERIDGGFRVINYHKYRELTYREAEAKRKYRRYHSQEISGEIQGLPEESASASASASASDTRENLSGNSKRTIHPAIEEVRAYCSERKSTVNPDQWYDYYASNGWKVGKNPMKDWRAAVRTWERKDTQTKSTQRKSRYADL